MSDAWNTIDLFRCIESPEPHDIIDLDKAMMKVLASLQCEKHSEDCGYSIRFPRYKTKYPDFSVKEEISALEQHYWARERQLRKLEHIIKEKKRVLQKNCDHEWERDWNDRGHRSHHECKKCGAYR